VLLTRLGGCWSSQQGGPVDAGCCLTFGDLSDLDYVDAWRGSCEAERRKGDEEVARTHLGWKKRDRRY
jgi:hypothetical protein